jgi:hypothetical protein
MLGMGRCQVAARLTALSTACKALEGIGSGKGADVRAQKALAKLEKVEKPVLSPASAACSAPGSSQPAPPTADPLQQEEAADPPPHAPDTTAAAEPASAAIPSQAGLALNDLSDMSACCACMGEPTGCVWKDSSLLMSFVLHAGPRGHSCSGCRRPDNC